MTERLIENKAEGVVKVKVLSIEIYIVIRETNIGGEEVSINDGMGGMIKIILTVLMI
eukprot:CAMPEP_0171313398 /NCGR_PEP_ID=MMETSP0816-20121228/42072_1 /TAXON_ID=420281 /ORGANISM="Proboscia inermis, Strain CCAP1064/1" /LENGTH=56 /DNA_ID=CAMNT_0011800723 /DNA_START=404 /DNA_END=574 /DNA_ORIENTATION=+